MTAPLPGIAVRLAGAALDGAPLAALMGLRVSRALSSPAEAELRFDGALDPPPLDAALTVSRDGRAAPLFEGRVTAVEVARRAPGRRVVTLLARDRLEGLRRTGRPDAHADATAGDLARAMADRVGLALRGPEADGPALPIVVRRRGMDLEHLLAETRRVGLWFHEREGALWLHGPDGAGAARPLDLGRALEWRLAADADLAAGALGYAAWAPGRCEAHHGLAFGLDEAAAFGAAGVPVGGEMPWFNLAVADADDAAAVAAAEMARRDAARVSLRAILDGDAALGLGDRLAVEGAPYPLAGPLAVTRLEERIDAEGGHVVEISTAPPPAAPPEPFAEAVWGQVAACDDPDGAGRVRCRLPTLGEVETGWLQVLRPMAGNGAGFAFAPGPGEDVLLLCPGGRPEHGVVLGSMAGSRRLHLDAAGGGRFGLRSPEGLALGFDDPDGAIEIATPGGTSLRLDGRGARLVAAGDLTLEAPGRTVTIRARRVDFEDG